jgi:hypothetical protein
MKESRIAKAYAIKIVLAILEDELRKKLPDNLTERELIEKGYEIVCCKLHHIKDVEYGAKNKGDR